MGSAGSAHPYGYPFFARKQLQSAASSSCAEPEDEEGAKKMDLPCRKLTWKPKKGPLKTTVPLE